MKRWHFMIIGMLAFFMTSPGCSRQWFRIRADRDADCVIAQKGGYLDNGQIRPPESSRMHDPHAIDCPPMPPDDPVSNQYMHRVDGMPGYPHWNKFGQLDTVEHHAWISYLPTDEDGEIRLDLRDAIRVARANSRTYQQNLETLYLTALDVSFERFRFDHQLFAGTGFAQDERGRRLGSDSTSAIDSAVGFNKLSATGGELLVGFANSLVWDSWGPDTDLFQSTIDFSLVQPLLRQGGRARVLENLTQTERRMLANVRQMQQFRQGFFVDIAVGRNSGSGPARGGAVGQSGLGLIAGFPSGRSGAADAGGYLGLLQDQQQIRNQVTNITALRDSLAQLEALFEAGRIKTSLQVDQARQALLNAQSSLLASKASYQSRVDAFKIELGLPPSLPIEIGDPFLDRFVLIDPSLTELQDEVAEILIAIKSAGEDAPAKSYTAALDEIRALMPKITERLDSAKNDLDKLQDFLPKRQRQLAKVGELIRRTDADVDPRVSDERRFMERIDYLRDRLPSMSSEFKSVQESEEGIRTALQEHGDDGIPVDDEIKNAKGYVTKISDLLLELSLVQAEARLQSIMLPTLEMEVDDAVALARLNRLDWMNARANLVDVWRKIEFFANDLKSNLNVAVDGQIGTEADNVLDFSGDDSRIRFSVQFDTPTARLAERNRYREALVNYQSARRDYMLFEDRVLQSIRNTLRLVTLSQINLEVRRAAVQVAISQVDNARLRLNPPLQAGQQSSSSPTAARDLVSALSDLLDAQNDFLNVWVSNEVLRILLDFETGTMQIDPTGMWMDPGPVGDTISDSAPENGAALENSGLESSDRDDFEGETDSVNDTEVDDFGATLEPFLPVSWSQSPFFVASPERLPTVQPTNSPPQTLDIPMNPPMTMNPPAEVPARIMGESRVLHPSQPNKPALKLPRD